MPSRSYELRAFQREALRTLEKPAHLICVAPTGSGKSLIYQRLAHRRGTRMLLVSPLIALARQQKKQLLEDGVRVSLAAGPDPEAPPDARTGVWIVSPERLTHPSTRRRLEEWKPGFLVVDECHCLWEWGERFRPAFMKIPEILRDHRIERSLWLTATLPHRARAELRQMLPRAAIERGGFELPPRFRISVERVDWSDRAARLMGWLSEHKEPGIIFVQTRATAARVLRLLSATGRSCTQYHAGLGAEERRNTELRIEERFPGIVVATSAFGMGMNYPHLRWALLWQAPPSLLALAQSIGRAGRDFEAAAEAKIFWDAEDFRLLEWMIQGSARRHAEALDVREFLSGEGCRARGLRNYFRRVPEDLTSTDCNRCDFCEAIQEVRSQTCNFYTL